MCTRVLVIRFFRYTLFYDLKVLERVGYHPEYADNESTVYCLFFL